MATADEKLARQRSTKLVVKCIFVELDVYFFLLNVDQSS